VKELKIYHFTGRRAANIKIAKSLNRKLKAAQNMGVCTLLDWTEITEIDPEFVSIVTEDLRMEKVCLAGLSSQWQPYVPVNFSLPPAPFSRA
jgi:hypothetical protein